MALLIRDSEVWMVGKFKYLYTRVNGVYECSPILSFQRWKLTKHSVLLNNFTRIWEILHWKRGMHEFYTYLLIYPHLLYCLQGDRVSGNNQRRGVSSYGTGPSGWRYRRRCKLYSYNSVLTGAYLQCFCLSRWQELIHLPWLQSSVTLFPILSWPPTLPVNSSYTIDCEWVEQHTCIPSLGHVCWFDIHPAQIWFCQ